MSILEPEDFADAYDRWADGRCPCCGIRLDPHDEAAEPIAEGVMLCGRCVENEHGREFDEFFPMMLRAIAEGAAR